MTWNSKRSFIVERIYARNNLRRDGDFYVGKYKALRSTFQKNYQDYIDAAIALKEGILFTSHGKAHFKTVITRAHKLMDKDP